LPCCHVAGRTPARSLASQPAARPPSSLRLLARTLTISELRASNYQPAARPPLALEPVSRPPAFVFETARGLTTSESRASNSQMHLTVWDGEDDADMLVPLVGRGKIEQNMYDMRWAWNEHADHRGCTLECGPHLSAWMDTLPMVLNVYVWKSYLETLLPCEFHIWFNLVNFISIYLYLVFFLGTTPSVSKYKMF
jgi:hypothetical protein